MRIDQIDVDLEDLAKWHEERGQKLNADLIRKAIFVINSSDEIKSSVNEIHKIVDS